MFNVEFEHFSGPRPLYNIDGILTSFNFSFGIFQP